MNITHEDMLRIEAEFGIRKGGWTKLAVEYLGLSYPQGETKDEPFDWRVTDEIEIKTRLDALDAFVSDLRKRADAAKVEIRKLRDQHAGEEW